MKIIFTTYVFILTELLLTSSPKYRYSLEIKSLQSHRNILENDYNKRGFHLKNMFSRIKSIKNELLRHKRTIEICYFTKKDEKKIEKIGLDKVNVISGIKTIIYAKYSNGINITEIMNHLLVSEMVPKILSLNPPKNRVFNAVIPIGNRCILAGILRGMKLHGASLPFDNIASSPRLLQPFFDKKNSHNYYLPFDIKSRSLMHNGLHFGHFNYKGNKAKHAEITESFKRKFERLFSILNDVNKKVLFVFADTDSLYKDNNTKHISERYYKELKDFDIFIKSHYKIKYSILCFHINEKFPDTETIKNYTIQLGHNENRNNLSGFYNIYSNTGQRYLWHLVKLEIIKILNHIKIV